MTHQTVQRSSLANLQVNLGRMAELQAKLSSGKNVQKPSDDPAATSDILLLDRQAARVAQYERNAQDATTWLNVADTTLQTSVKSLTAARTLLVQAGNGGYGQAEREAIALELEGIRDDLLRQANTSVNGRTVFAGTSDAGEGWTLGTDGSGARTYTHTASVAGATTPVLRRVGDAVTVRVDADGAAAYGDGATSVFAVLDAAATALRTGGANGPDVTPLLQGVDGRLEALKAANAAVGSRQNLVQNAQSDLASASLTVKDQRARVQDIDLAAVTIDLQAQEIVYKSALAATAKTLQPSLLDFLR
ncbi:flagellar hook-associated protein FlgL [Cellulomonas marina]|uniref:flagellar hook-associated protein FlgL n=1 Tax=Cellulomonas marina TaxID=988821 RepID=UPI001EF2DBE7|nr:flagellar hook-associated protein FlgL [Cellulomonas marina]